MMITCEQHDYIEIICTFRYPVKLTLRSGDLIECVALDTMFNEFREECVKVERSGAECLIALENISILEVCVENPHFQVIRFK